MGIKFSVHNNHDLAVQLKGLLRDVCLKFHSSPNFIHQQYEAIFKQDDHFQIHRTLNRATRGIWRKRK